MPVVPLNFSNFLIVLPQPQFKFIFCFNSINFRLSFTGSNIGWTVIYLGLSYRLIMVSIVSNAVSYSPINVLIKILIGLVVPIPTL